LGFELSTGRSGTRTARKNPEKTAYIDSRAAIGAALPTGTGANPAESPDLLARMAAAWNRLTEADRAAVVELAEGLAGAFDAVADPLPHSDLPG